jgi:hypothetical protein
MTCDRCEAHGRDVQATTHQEYRYPSDPESWGNTSTDRCDRCAQDLRNYCALPSISMVIVVDEPLAVDFYAFRVGSPDYAKGISMPYATREAAQYAARASRLDGTPVGRVRKASIDEITAAHDSIRGRGIIPKGW